VQLIAAQVSQAAFAGRDPDGGARGGRRSSRGEDLLDDGVIAVVLFGLDHSNGLSVNTA